MSLLFDLRNSKKQDIYIFGMGVRGRTLLSILMDNSINVKGFIDNSPTKQGSIVQDKKCMDLETAINQSGTNLIIIISPLQCDEIIAQFKKLGINNIFNGEKIFQEYYSTPLVKEESDYRAVRPFNHYESAYPDIRQIHEKEDEIFNPDREILEIDFNIERQLALLKEMESINLIPWDMHKKSTYRYYYDNSWYEKGCADILYYMMRILNPNRIIEVGSGFSTAVMLDTNNAFFDNCIEINCIEPNSERLKSLLREDDNIKISEYNLQDVPLDYFEQLKENDILFIDSSHVSRLDSDVNYYLFEIFPRLAKGVYIHIHDIFYPFIYPKQWVYEGRAYNEMYLLRAFLMNNDKYTIQFFGEMLMHQYSDCLSNKLKNISGSIWLRKENV